MKKKSVKHLLHFMLLCMPLILLLIACIFPTKQINNIYALTSSEETETIINFNQLVQENLTSQSNGVTLTFDSTNHKYIISGTNTNSVAINLKSISTGLNDHYYMVYGYRGYSNISLIADGCELIANDSTNYKAILKCSRQTIFYIYCAYNFNGTYSYSFQLFDLTEMGLENINISDFNALFPLDYYSYNEGQEITLSTLVNNVGNEAQAPLQVNETKQPNEAILMPYKAFYALSVNDWYRSLLELIGVDISSTDIVQGYLLYFPLWAMWFWLFELIELAVTLVPKLVYDIYTKLSRSKDE